MFAIQLYITYIIIYYYLFWLNIYYIHQYLLLFILVNLTLHFFKINIVCGVAADDVYLTRQALQRNLGSCVFKYETV